MLVAGAAIFGTPDPEAAAAGLRALARAGRAPRRAGDVTRSPATIARARALRRNRPDAGRLPRELLRLVRSGPDRPAASARLVVSRDGSRPASSCRSSRRTAGYRRPARYDDEIEIRTAGRLVSAGADGSSTTRPCGAADDVVDGNRADAARSGHPGRAALPAARPREGPVSMKALITGVAGFIGIAPRRGAAAARRDGHRHRLLHRLLSAARSRKPTSRPSRRSPGSRSSRRRFRTRTWRRCSTA